MIFVQILLYPLSGRFSTCVIIKNSGKCGRKTVNICTFVWVRLCPAEEMQTIQHKRHSTGCSCRLDRGAPGIMMKLEHDAAAMKGRNIP